MLTSRLSRLIVIVAFVAASPALAACSFFATPGPVTNCAPGLFEYQGGCLTAASQNFASCTRERGQNLSVDERTKLEGSIDAGIKGGGGGVVEFSKTVVETELPDVALRIVEICLELSKDLATPVEALGIDAQLDVLQQMLDATSQGEITLSPATGPYEQAIHVSGTNWPPNIEMEVSAMTLAKKRATTDADGSFVVDITLDPTFKDVAPSTITVRAAPVKASVQRAATALYEIVE